MCVIFPKERLFVVTCRPFTKYLYIRVKTEDYLTYFLTYSFRRIPWTMTITLKYLLHQGHFLRMLKRLCGRQGKP